MAAELAFGAYFARHPGHLGGEHRKLLDHGVDEVGGAQELASQWPPVYLQIHGLPKITFRHCANGARHLGCRPHEIVEEGIDGIDLFRPSADSAGQGHALL